MKLKRSKNKKTKQNASAAAEHAQKKMVAYMVDQEVKKAALHGMNRGYSEATAIMLWVLHTKYGFGNKRLMTFLGEIQSFVDYYMIPSKEPGGYDGLSINEIGKGLAEECNIAIDWENGLIGEAMNREIVKRKEELDAKRKEELENE